MNYQVYVGNIIICVTDTDYIMITCSNFLQTFTGSFYGKCILVPTMSQRRHLRRIHFQMPTSSRLPGTWRLSSYNCSCICPRPSGSGSDLFQGSEKHRSNDQTSDDKHRHTPAVGHFLTSLLRCLDTRHKTQTSGQGGQAQVVWW